MRQLLLNNMIRPVPAAALGSCLLLIFLLAHAILHELSIASDISAKIDRLSAGVHPSAAGQSGSAPFQEAVWAEVFKLATESPDIDSFINRLKQSNVAPKADQRPARDWLVNSQGLLATAPAELSDTDKELLASQAPVGVGTSDNHRTDYPVLTKELAISRAKANAVFVTWTNFHFIDFVQNWILHLQDIGVTNYLVGAMDADTADALSASGEPMFAMFTPARNGSASTIGGHNLGWGSERFHQMGRLKIELLQTFLSYGLDIMLCDSDTVWLRDPSAYIRRFPAADMLVSSDHLAPTSGPGDDGLEQPQAAHSAMNIGIMFVRATEASRAFVDMWVDVLRSENQTWDQNVFNHLAMQDFNLSFTHESNDRLFYGWQQQLILGVLPVATFASGHTFHVQHAYELQQLQPYVVHQTFQYGGTKGKRHRLREAHLWKDPLEYYKAGGPFLHAELAQLPAPPDFHSSHNNTLMSDFHLQNMEFQLLQMRDVFAMAATLNRTVILPKLMCYCDRYWGPVDACRIPGAPQTRLPFVCPLDHVLEPFHMDDDPDKFGPPIRFREHSFLDSKQVPDSIRSDVLHLEIGADAPGSSGGPIAGDQPAAVVHTLFSGLTQQVLQLRYSAGQDTGVQRFLQEPLAEEALQQGFLVRLSHMPAFWCCRMAAGEDATVKPLGAAYAPMMLGRGIVVQ